ncbi:MAG: hypothetical protein QOH96_396 [Blastocatellia bacterium]|nr:hypothetical protein [Blastocatellia bacterium]
MLDKPIAGFLACTVLLVIVAVRETYTQSELHSGASAHEQISNNVPAKPKLDLRTFVAEKTPKPKPQTTSSTEQKQLQTAKLRAMPDSTPWSPPPATIVLIALVVSTVCGVALAIHRDARSPNKPCNKMGNPVCPTK